VWNSKLNNLGKTGEAGGQHLGLHHRELHRLPQLGRRLDTSYDPVKKTGTNTQSGQLTADFSWLLAQKAAWNNVKALSDPARLQMPTIRNAPGSISNCYADPTIDGAPHCGPRR
jgi:hypothetical protein